MRLSIVLVLAVAGATFLAPELASQVEVETDLFIADRGSQMNGSDGEIRRYTHTGMFLNTLPAAGSGALRGIGFDLDDNLFVARGNSILRYTGDPFVPDAAGFATGTKAQNVEINPVTGNVWASFGVNATEAELREYDTTGLLLQTITDPLFVQLRSFCFSEDGDRIFLANVEGNNVLVGDVSVTPPVFVVHSSARSIWSGGLRADSHRSGRRL